MVLKQPLNLDAVDDALLPQGVVDSKLLDKHRALPLAKRGNRPYLAVADPSNLQVLDDTKFQTGLIVEPVVVEEDKLIRALDRLAPQSAADIMQAIDTEDLGLEVQAEGTTAAQDAAAQEVDDAPVVRYLQKMMLGRPQQGGVGHPL